MYALNEESVPSLADDNVEIAVGESPRFCNLQFPDINISVIPQNPTTKFASFGVCLPIIPIIFPFYPEEINEDPLTVEVVLAPQSDALTFEPMKAKLIINDSVYTPTNYKGPIPIRGGITECDYLHRDFTTDPYTAMDIAIKITNNVCFELKFPVETFKTKKEFTFELLGLKKDGQDYEVPQLIFRREHKSDGLILG